MNAKSIPNSVEIRSIFGPKSVNIRSKINSRSVQNRFGGYHWVDFGFQNSKQIEKIENNISKVKTKKCNGTLGALLGGGVAASLSAVDAYGWSIPLGLVLGKGIANSEC